MKGLGVRRCVAALLLAHCVTAELSASVSPVSPSWQENQSSVINQKPHHELRSAEAVTVSKHKTSSTGSQAADDDDTLVSVIRQHSNNNIMAPIVPTTAFASFGSSTVSAFTLTLFTEFGDRTFFIAALLATKYDKYAVLVGTCAALFFQSALAAALGRLLHALPSSSSSLLAGFPIDDYTASVFLLFFAYLHIKEGMKTSELPASCEDNIVGLRTPLILEQDKPVGSSARLYHQRTSLRQEEIAAAQATVDQITATTVAAVISKSFWVIAAAELGDKSMIATVALATAQNPYGVVLGAMGGHFIVTLVGVFAGAALHSYVTERTANLAGGVLFLIFGILTLAEALAKQGVWLWTKVATNATVLGVVAHRAASHLRSNF